MVAARLRDEEGWSQQRIAAAKNVDEADVSRRLKYHTLPDSAKRAVVTGDLTEGHLQAISAVVVTSQLAAWLTTEAAWVELAEAVVRDKAKNGAKSVAATRQDVATWREFIAYAQQVWSALPESVTLHDCAGAATARWPRRWACRT